MSQAKQHLYNALNTMGAATPPTPIDVRDAIIEAQDVALSLDEDSRIAVCEIVTLLRSRIATLDRFAGAWQRSAAQIKLAISELEAETTEPPYGTPEWTAAVDDVLQRSISKRMTEIPNQ